MASLGEATLSSGFDPSGMLKDLQAAKRRTDSFLGGWTSAFRGAFSTALGFLGAQVFTGIVRGLRNIARAGFEVITGFEQTGVAFRTMLGDAALAAGMLRDLAEFAATTPFELAEVEAGAKQLLAMGSSAVEIIPELKMLGDVSAGLSVPIERLIQNYGQVRTQTILTGRELRDFSMAGVPLIAELADMMGKTTAEIKDMVSEGTIGFADVQQAFANMTSEGGKFHDLMQQQSLTTAGRISNLKDRMTILARAIGTPLLNGVNQLISAFSRLAATFGPGGSMYQATLAVSAFASLVLEKLGFMANNAVDKVEDMGQGIASRFISMAQRALQWGIDVIGQFAVGMIRGATQALTMAMNFITGLLSYWMNPQSPPRFLPDIDKWGTGAFTEFLRGFTTADFGILDNLQSPIKSALQNIEQLAKSALDPEDKKGAAMLAVKTTEAYASLSAGIAEAIDLAKRTGQVNEGILSEVASATGKFGNEIARALKFELQMVSATKRLEDAQKRLTAAQERRSDASSELREAEAELLFQQRFGTDLQAVDDAEYQVFLAEDRLRLAQDEEAVAEASLGQEKEKQATIEDQLGAQNALINQLLDMQDMQINPMLAMQAALKEIKEDLKGAVETAAELSESIFAGMGDITPIGDNIDSAFEAMKTRIQEKWAEMIGSADDPDSLAGRWHLFVNEDIPKLADAFDDLKLALDGFTDSAGMQLLMSLFGVGGEDGLDPGKIGEIAGNVLVFALAASLAGKALGAIGAIGTLIGGLNILVGTDGLLLGFIATLPIIPWPLFLIGMALIGLALLQNNEDFIAWRDGVNETYSNWQDDTNESIDNVLINIGTFFEDLLGITGEEYQAWIDDVNAWYDTWLTDTNTWINEGIGKLVQGGKDFISGLWGGMTSVWENSVKPWLEGIAEAALAIWDFVTGTQSPSKEMYDRGEWWAEGLLGGIQNIIPEINATVASLGGGLSSGFGEAAMAAQFGSATMGRARALTPVAAGAGGGDTLVFNFRDTTLTEESLRKVLRDRDMKRRRVR